MKLVLATSPKSRLVLVAASDDARRARLLDLVEASGNRVLEALDGFHAVAIATRYVPDLLIADAVLPQLDGLQVMARLRQNPDATDVSAIVIGDGSSAAGAGDPTVAVVESIDDVARRMLLSLSRRTATSDAAVMLRRAMADVRAKAGDPGALDGAAVTRARVREMANGAEEPMISVMVADDNARFIEANAAACALSGYSRDELLSMTIWDLTPDQYMLHDRRLWERFKRDGRYEGPHRIRRRSGESVTIRCASLANVVPGLHVVAMAPPRLLEAIRN